jgi:hypothetical protein
MADETPDLFLRKPGRLTINGITFANVRCIVRPPARDSGGIIAEFEFATDGGNFPLPGEGSFEFDSCIDLVGKWRRERVRLTEIQVKSSTPRFLGGPKVDGVALADAGTLEVCKIIDVKDAQRKLAVVSLVLTRNDVLERLIPARLAFPDEKSGDEDHRTLLFPSIGHSSFGIHYDWSGDNTQRHIQAKYCLVAKFEMKLKLLESAEELAEHLPEIDNSLLLFGFATRIPMRCVGWIVQTGRSTAEYYRRTQWLLDSVSRQKKQTAEGLVHLKSLLLFLEKSATTFHHSVHKDSIKNAIHALNNSVEETIETRFLSLFAAFEGLLTSLTKDSVKRNHSKKKAERTKVREKLVLAIQEMESKESISEETREQFLKAVRNVELFSFSDKLRELARHFPSGCKDLWPLVEPNSGMSLYRLRNTLAHGRGFKAHHLTSVVVACHHIECHLERLLCSTFEWPLEFTDIEVGSLRRHWHDETVDWRIPYSRFGDLS